MANYSLTELASDLGFDAGDYSPLLKLFVDTTDSDLIGIRSAVAKEDSDLISSNIHNIRGASMNLGLDKITAIVEEMNELNKAGAFADIENMVQECEAELSDIRKLLE